MTWDEYYDKYYDWAESTRIKKLSSVDVLGDTEEVSEVMLDLAFNHEDIVNRIARKAIEQKLVFTADDIINLTGNIDPFLQAQLAYQSVGSFSKEDLRSFEGYLDDDVIVQLYKLKGLKMPDIFINDDDSEEASGEDFENKPSGFFSTLAMAFGIGHGIQQGINDAVGKPIRKFRVGDRVRVRYRGQEGTVIDINGDLYMVSMNSGAQVDSYYEDQLEKAW